MIDEQVKVVYEQDQDQDFSLSNQGNGIQESPSRKGIFISPQMYQNEGMTPDMNDLEVNSLRNKQKRQSKFFSDKDADKPADIEDGSSNNRQQSQKVLSLYLKNHKINQKLEKTQKQKVAIDKNMIITGQRFKNEYINDKRILGAIKWIIGVTFLIAILSIILIMVNVLILKSILFGFLLLIDFYNDLSENISYVNKPVRYNMFYCTTFVYSWLLYLNQNSYPISQFILNQIHTRSIQNQQIMVNIWEDMQAIYLIIQGNHFQSNQTIFVDGQILDSYSFSKFSQIIYEKQHILLQWTSNISEINQQIVSNIQFLEDNLMNHIQINQFVIDQLQTLFTNQIDFGKTVVIILVVFEIVFLSLCFGFQAYLWMKSKKYQESQLILLLRMYDQDVNQIKTRLQIVSDLLADKKSVPWKKFNYFELAFSQIQFQFGDLLMGENKNQISDIVSKQSHLRVNTSSTKKPIKQQNKNLHKNTVQRSILSARVEHPYLSNIKIYFFMTFLLMCSLGYYGTIFGIYNSQQDYLMPSIDLTVDFLLFTQNIDLLILSGLVSKTYLLQDKIPYNKDLFHHFIQPKEQQESLLDHFYEQILQSERIDENKKKFLYNLYSDNFCLELEDIIPFCQFNQSDVRSFQDKFGQYNQTDNNVLYLSKGIVGIISEFNQFVNENFIYDENGLINDHSGAIYTKDFRNIFVQHFLDSFIGFQQFMETITNQIMIILDDDYEQQLLIYILGGVLLIIILCGFEFYWIRKRIYEIRLTKLGLATLPIETLTEAQIQQAIKLLQK